MPTGAMHFPDVALSLLTTALRWEFSLCFTHEETAQTEYMAGVSNSKALLFWGIM